MKNSQHLQKYEFRCDLLSSAKFKRSLGTIYLILLLLGLLSALEPIPVDGQARRGPTIHDPTTCNRSNRYNSSDTFHVFACEPANERVLQSPNIGSSAKPALSSNSIQHYNNLEEFDPRDITAKVGVDLIAGESDPIVDIKAFGGRAVRSASGFSTTANCDKTKSITLDSATSFQNGDGITIYGCGLKNTLSTPGAPTVVPSIATGGTTTGIVTNSLKGGATVSYRIVARDKLGALTAAGAATTIENAQITLGLNTATITTCSRSNRSVTCNTSSSTPLVANALVHITASSNADFDGWYIVNTINSGTQFVINNTPIDSRGKGWQFGDSSGTTGGNIAFYLSNHLTWTPVTNAWEYYIYMQAGGSGAYNLIGQTNPSGDGWFDVQFDDYGSTYMANQTFPDYVPTTAPSVATNDPLTTTIVSGAGTTSIVVANSASQTASGQTAWFDDGPAIKAAAAAAVTAQGTLYIPSGYYYPVHSHLILPTFFTIRQSGYLEMYETIELTGDVNWFGDWGQHGDPQFSFIGASSMDIVTANPGLYLKGVDNYIAYMTIASNGTNGGTMVVTQNIGNSDWDYVNFFGNQGSSLDYLSHSIIFRATSAAGNNIHFRKALFNAGPDQITDKSWTPLVYFPPSQNGSGGLLGNDSYQMRCMECFLNRRGFEEEIAGGTIGTFEFDGGYRQGGITPFVMFGNSVGAAGGSLILHSILQDTESAGSTAFLATNGNSIIAKIDASFLSNASVDGNGVPPPFTGNNPIAMRSFGSSTGTVPNTVSDLTAIPCVVTYPFAITGTNQCGITSMEKFFEPVDFPAGHSLFWDLAPPTTINAEEATVGGSLASDTTYYYTVSVIGVDGGETVPTTIASLSKTTPSNRTISVSWTGKDGATGYNVYRCIVRCVFSDRRIQNNGNWRLIAQNIMTTRIIDNGLGVGQSPPTATGTGSVGANATEIYAPSFVTVSPTSNGKSYTAVDTAPITANRTYTKPDQSGTYALVLSASTPIINGRLLSSSCISGTVKVPAAIVGMPVIVSTVDGSDVGNTFNIRASVTNNNIVTVYVCGTGTPPSKAYNVRVIQ